MKILEQRFFIGMGIQELISGFPLEVISIIQYPSFPLPFQVSPGHLFMISWLSRKLIVSEGETGNLSPYSRLLEDTCLISESH